MNDILFGNNNQPVIKKLAAKAFAANRTRNLIAAAAIALTALLFTALFTIVLSGSKAMEQSNLRQVGTSAHGSFKNLTKAQFDELKTDPLIKEWGLRRYLGSYTEKPFNQTHVEIGYSDAKQRKWSFYTLAAGHFPEENTDEAAVDTTVLKFLGVEPTLGAHFTLSFEVDGKPTTQAFTLCGWWDFDATGAHQIFIPESRVNAVLAEVQVTPPGENRITKS